MFSIAMKKKSWLRLAATFGAAALCLSTASSGFHKTVTAQNARKCPNYQQYIGKIVNFVEGIILIGALRFPENKGITELEDAAKAVATQQDALDATTLGRWRN